MALYRDSRENTASPKFKWQCDSDVEQTTDDQQSGLGPHHQIGYKLLKSCLDKFHPYIASAAIAPGGDFGTVKRPDGGNQVTYNGKLLYSFAEDKPGEVTGNGFQDAFGGQQFTWHVVHAQSAQDASGSGTGTSSGRYGY